MQGMRVKQVARFIMDPAGQVVRVPDDGADRADRTDRADRADRATAGGKKPMAFLQYIPKSSPARPKKPRKKGLAWQLHVLKFEMKEKADRRW